MNDFLKLFSNIFLGIGLLVANFVLIFLIAPAMVSAPSTLSVVAGFLIVATVLVADVAAVMVVVKKLYNNSLT